jgi:signal transduction histidine kinase
MKDDNFQTIGVVSVGRDLTERKKLESQLLQSQKFAALGVMAGGIAHELRNPLAICSSAAQFLQEDYLSRGFRKECAEKIHTGIQRASIIIENLLRFARPSGNPRMQRIDLNCLVDDTLQLVGNQARIQKIELRIALRDQPVWVDGNESLLQQVLINLFLNAIRAMPDGGVLSLSVIETENSAAIRMRDTGHGISDQDIDKIFDPFYTTSSVGKGTGLGLAITYSIVRQHLGHIEVDSTRGIGTEITVTLPGQSRH